MGGGGGGGGGGGWGGGGDIPDFCFVRLLKLPSLVKIMAWRRPGDKPLSEPMIIILLTHICITRPQIVKASAVLPCHYKVSWRQKT